MTAFSFILSSARHYSRAHLGLLFGAFLASAILSGSLLVGDSVKASLQRVAALRLGKVQSGLVGGDRWFTNRLAQGDKHVPLVVANGSVSVATGTARVNAAQVLGVDQSFWKLSTSGKPVAIGADEVAVNESLARKLNVKPGDTIIVRLEKPSAISRDAPLSGAANEDVALRRKVVSIVRAEDFGAFQLAASQVPPDSAFLDLKSLQGAVQMDGRVNALLSQNSMASLQESAALEDYALKLTRVKTDKPEWELSTDRVFLDNGLADKLLAKLPQSSGSLTYLVNALQSGKGSAPYSMVTAVDTSRYPDLRFKGSGKTTDPSLIINQWLAEDQNLAVGDKLSLRYFVVGTGREMKEVTTPFTVEAILPMDDPRMSRSWMPDFPGVSDAANCRDWDPGFPMDKKAIRDKDEKYWADLKGTPKAFIELGEGMHLWGNRFGYRTAVRFADSGQNESELRKDIAGFLSLSDIGLVVTDFKAQAAAAAKGSVDFGGLFIGLSMFLIAAALVFAALLFLFMIERRASQVGLLVALGWSTKQVRNALLGEAGVIALAGSALGLLGGMAYTKAALAGLNGVWGGATAGLKLVFAAQPVTLIIAGVAAFAVSMFTLWWATRKLFRAAPRSLLAGEGMNAVTPSKKKPKPSRWKWWAILGFVGAIALGFAGSKATSPEAIGGMFFGAGTMLMIAALATASGWMKAQATGQSLARSLWQIGVRNVVRRPGRSLAVLGMMAGGIFLVVAVNAFRISAGSDSSKRQSGTGGFALIGESSLPVYEDLNKTAGRDAFGLDDEDMQGVRVVPFRVRPGDDASCLNLNRAQNPQLVGVDPIKLSSVNAFAFSGAGDWQLLKGQSTSEVPAIADMATAMWGLGKGVGDVIEYDLGGEKKLRVKLVALLAGSVLQGKIIIDEAAFVAAMPDTAGYRFYLIDAPAGKADAVAASLMRQVEPRGLALEPTTQRLNAFSAVQNTYIGIFTVLGGLGVLLGTAGLGVLVARHVMERKGELGLLQAIGFKPSALRRLVIGEHTVLLLGGTVLGVLSAALAVWPNLQQSSHDLPMGFVIKLVAAIVVFGFLICALAATTALRGRLVEAIRKE